MASKDHLVDRLAALLAGFDDAAWEALSSKGLLRRARKDMEKGLPVEITGETASGLEISIPPVRVSMPASGPAGAACTCPAPGICQHILIAGLFLQTRSGDPMESRQPVTAASIREEIRALGPDQIRAWAGAVDYRGGESLLEKNSMTPVIEYGEAVLIRLMPGAVEVRYVPGGGLEGMIAPAANGRRVAVAALLALRAALGFEAPLKAEQRSLIDLAGTPRTQKEILASAARVLEDAVGVGLSHLSPALADRLMTLSVSAQGAGLQRVALALRTIADEAGSIVRREARADEAQLFVVAARTYALIEAIARADGAPRPALAGSVRSQYVDVPEMDLNGVGAYTWRTGSGYYGLTVLFWSNQAQEFLSWAEARPGNQQFDPRRRFHGEGPWDGTQSPRQAASSHLKLRNARRTVGGRLSGSTKTGALVLGPVAQALEFGERLFGSWDALHSYARRKQPLGLGDSNPLDLVAVLEPSAFGARSYDAITQTFLWEVHDERDRVLTLSLPFREWSKDAIRILEGLRPPQGRHWRVVARLALREDLLVAEPVSLLRPGDETAPVFQLAFDALPQESTRRPAPSPAPVEEEEGPAEEREGGFEDTQASGGSSLRGLVAEVNRRLEAIAESGCGSEASEHRAWFEQAQRGVSDAGLTCLAAALRTLAEPSNPAARAVLRARYVTLLHSQAAVQAS